MRVARVTPLYTTSTPSVPSYTISGGIPTDDAPNRAICLCSLTGSAPPGREGGTRNSRGSTSRKSEGIPGPESESSEGTAPLLQRDFVAAELFVAILGDEVVVLDPDAADAGDI